ncbi:MAG TPA: amidohydrolase family protein [Blastocatellia bacterium]|nr:amidohydrolase family protein [Blastocatellia bacterium]
MKGDLVIRIAWRFLLCLIALSLCGAPGAEQSFGAAAQQIVLAGGTVIDGNGGTPLKDAIVLIEDDRIVRVGRKGQVKYTSTAKVIDMTGKYLLPGLIDMHIHYDGWMGELFLAHGVTTVKDLGNDVEWTSAMSADIESGRVSGPRLFYVGNGLDMPPPERDHHIGLETPEMAKRAVTLLHSRGASAIKVREKLTPELLRAIVQQARALGIPVTGHIGRTNAREAALAGINGIEHASGIVEVTATGQLKPDKPPQNELDQFIIQLRMFSLIDLEKAKELVKFLAARKVSIVPTMSNKWRMGSERRNEFAREDAEYAKNPSLAYVPQHVRQLWATSFLFNVKDADDLAQIKEGYRKLQEMLKEFHRAGGMITAGSDTLMSVPGLSLQRELLFLVDAGFTPMESITIATRNNAQLLGKSAELGTITPRKLADIVILDGDPLEDIRNIFKVAMVIKGGKVVDTTYHANYSAPTPKPKPVRPLWVERQLQQRSNSATR